MSDDPKLKDFIGRVSTGEASCRLIGFPSDEGVQRNGGRPGASGAPESIYGQLLKLTPHAAHIEQHTKLLKQTGAMEQHECTGELSKDQIMLGENVSKTLKMGQIPVILGGGHETSFGHFLGYAEAGQPVHIVNIDAHTDVRMLNNGLPHSGSPFRQAIEHESGRCRSYNVYGLNAASVSADHLNYVKQQGDAAFEQSVTEEGVLNRLNLFDESPIMVTMDMDVVRHSDAPGVSAPNSSGISKELWLKLAYGFGNHPKVASFDLCEVNPEFDRDHQTVKLAALTVWYFLLGVALR